MQIKIKKHIPNSITSLNLLSGCLSILLAFEGYLTYAVYLIFAAAIFDFLDGLSARVLKAYSNVGKELDSLADIVSFGVAPAVIVFHMMKIALFRTVHMPPLESLTIYQIVFLIAPFLIAVLSGVRLAKFNVDDRQSDSFIGLAVPANALFFVSLYLIPVTVQNEIIIDLLQNKYLLSGLSLIFSLFLA